jgi:hypothetical protein
VITLRHLKLAILSGGAYAASPDGLVIDAGNDIRAVLTELDGDLVVAIRGTLLTSVDNILTDLDAIPSFHAEIGNAPRGFLLAAMSLMPLLAPHIAGRQVVVTGHSLGGSVAILVSALLAVAGTPPVETVAFEPARTGLSPLAARLKSVKGTIYRFGNDPVPEVPPWPYRHPWSVTEIGHPMLDPIACHAIGGVIAWLQSYCAEVTA